ncbi:hypothetical protein SEPCBS119000_004472 [Sporothrix epigloea]|uniref:LysM domain-containing protein n=1 Tax=Sporothrix epigloea TaxID=1892477 RepID=A0ABP0DWB9_9PEZI
MRSAIFLLGASLALARADGFPGFSGVSQTQLDYDAVPTATQSDNLAVRDSTDRAAQTSLSDAAIELHCPGGHCHKKPEPTKCQGGHCHKPALTTTVTKVCKECMTITKPVTIMVPDPTTIVKTRMCTTTLIRSRTVTRCVDHTKTDTKYCPVYKTSVQTVTVKPTCAPKCGCNQCQQWQVKHVVEEGDDCQNLAAVYNTTIEDIQATNTWLNSTCDLTTGEILCISSGNDVLVDKRDVAHHHHHHHKEDGGMTWAAVTVIIMAIIITDIITAITTTTTATTTITTTRVARSVAATVIITMATTITATTTTAIIITTTTINSPAETTMSVLPAQVLLTVLARA